MLLSPRQEVSARSCPVQKKMSSPDLDYGDLRWNWYAHAEKWPKRCCCSCGGLKSPASAARLNDFNASFSCKSLLSECSRVFLHCSRFVSEFGAKTVSIAVRSCRTGQPPSWPSPVTEEMEAAGVISRLSIAFSAFYPERDLGSVTYDGNRWSLSDLQAFPTNSLVDAISASVWAKLGWIQPKVSGPVGGAPPHSGLWSIHEENTPLWLIFRFTE